MNAGDWQDDQQDDRDLKEQIKRSVDNPNDEELEAPAGEMELTRRKAKEEKGLDG